MKDELRELEMDESTRKTATDWLMQVISGKRSNGNGNGSGHLEDSISGGGVAVAEMPETEMPRAAEPAQEFTADDLCGAPVVPVVKAVAPKDEITADDVCWVPEEMRLKPQPPSVQELPASNVHVMPSPETREELDLRRPGAARDPELSYLTGASETVITAADISRDPAPYMVEPTWNGRDSASEMSEITAADITRDSLVSHVLEPSVSELPTSFRVIRSIAPQATPPPAQVVEAPAPVLEAAAPEIEAPAPAFEAAAPEIEAPVPMIEAAAPVFEAPAPVVEAPASVIEAAASFIEAPAPAPEAPTPMAEVPAGDVAEGVAEAHETGVISAHSEALAEKAEPRLEPVAAEDMTSDEAGSGENVFARQGFWGEATKGEPGEVEASRKAILRGMKRAYPGSGSEEFDKHPEGWFSAWKTMLRLGAVLPWVARALPALESGALNGEAGMADTTGATAAPGIAQETRQDVAGLRLVQYEIRTTVQDHSMQLKRIEEQLTRVRESVDSRSSEDAEIAENLRAMTKLMRLAGLGLGALLLVLIVLVIVMMAHR